MFDEVYLITDRQKLKRIITAVTFAGNNCRYCLSCGESESWHFTEEMQSYSVINSNSAGFKS